ncbi:MAG: N-acetylmuramoyl-L-alanine amidase [Robiginitomaculum sp.]|nr:MAG: N-acetylmuramoyl-L-alanine amidase [Robiginitomaculum sp.]
MHGIMKKGQLVVLAILAAMLFPAVCSANAADVTQVRFSGNAEQTRIVIETREEFDYRWFSLAQNGLRLVLDMPVVNWQFSGTPSPVMSGSGEGYGAVKRYRFGQYSPTTSRLVFDLTEAMDVEKDFFLKPAKAGAPYRLVLDLRKTDPITFAAEAGFQKPFIPRALKGNATTTEIHYAGVPSRKKYTGLRRDRKVIVIDAGHGGKDPGTVGKRQREKNVNLRAAKALKKRLEKSGHYLVRLTRSSDIYVPLVDRVRFARTQEADLLISLHSDAARNTRARGASVYTRIEWAGKRTKKEIMQGDRSIIGVDIASARPGVDDILLNLSQRQTQNESAIFAEILTLKLARVGPMLPNSHRDKNLFVLLAPDVPSVLIEMGFLSNKSDEANLSSDRYIRKLMGAVGESVDTYFKQTARLHASR